MIGSLLVGFLSFVVFLFYQANGIYTGDSGDLATAAAVGGVPHPPGYPLYTVLGWALAHLPLFTVSWRISLLSSIPHAVTIALVYMFIFRLTKGNIVASVFGALCLATNYIFFLYSVTPEVFALFDLFVVLFWLLLVLWVQTNTRVYFFAAMFTYGLSLSHHHLMLFFVPAIGLFFWMHKKNILMIFDSYRTYVLSVLSFVSGLVPYFYIPIAARSDRIINWNRAIDWDAFVHLVSRADYGTFVSGGAFGQTIQERLLAIHAYGMFVLTDWTWIGIAMVLFGGYALFLREKHLFWTWILASICIGPLFFFYASFPLINRFTLGTYERFLLPSYVLFAITSGVGLSYLMEGIRRKFTLYSTLQKRNQVAIIFAITCMVYPITIGGMTAWRFWGLSFDRTAENLGRDILETATENAIILLSQDTSLFTTQFVRYVLGVRSDTAVIHVSRLPLPDYQVVLKKYFPDLVYPSNVSQGSYVSTFIRTNSLAHRRVYSNTILPLEDGWYWVTRGLLYEAVPSHELPIAEEMYTQFSSISARLHDPRSGVLERYPHLMLSDVLDVYAHAHLAVGKTLVKAEKWKEAREEFKRAVMLSGDTTHVESLELLGVSELYFKECTRALDAFTQAQKASHYRSPLHVRLTSMTYGECFGDEVRAREIFSEYEKLRDASEESLESL